MVYRYKPETTKSSQGLKLIEPAVKPRDLPITKEMELVRSQAGLRAQHRLQEQAQAATTFYKEGDKVWVLNPDKSKLQPEKVGPYVIIKKKTKTLIFTQFETLEVSINHITLIASDYVKVVNIKDRQNNQYLETYSKSSRLV